MKKSLILILIITFAFYCCKGNNNQEKQDEKSKKNESVSLTQKSIEDTGIKTSIVKFTSINGFLIAPARIIADQDNEATVGSLVKGRVRKVFANAGDNVKAGQELMELEGLEIGEIRSAYLKAKAHLDFTESAYKRQKSLFEQNVSAQKSVLESKSEYEKAQAEFKAEDEKIHSIGLTDEEVLNNSNAHSSGKLTIKAPISGVIIERNAVIGQLVDDNTTAFKIINTTSVFAEAQIYEKDMPKVTGKPAVSFSSTVYPGDLFNGRLVFVSQVVDEKTRTISLRAALTNSGNKLRPQMFGELKIPIDKNSKALVITSEAIINDNGKYFVFVQTNDSTFEKRDVEIGIKENDLVEIRSGIKENEKVVIKGAFYLKSELLKSSFGEGE